VVALIRLGRPQGSPLLSSYVLSRYKGLGNITVYNMNDSTIAAVATPTGAGGNDSTIAAVATPTGAGGIGIIKISGQNALPIASHIFRRSHSSISNPEDKDSPGR